MTVYIYFLITLPFSVLRALSPWGLLGLLKSFVSWLSKLLCLFIMAVVQLFSCSVVSDTLWPMDCSTPGFLVLHYLPELAQTHVHWVGDAIQPSYPLLPSSPALNLSQHQGIFKWVGSSHQVARVLELWQLGMFQFSCSVVCDSLLLHGLQHSRLPCPSPTPRACSNSRPLSWWCHPTILSSVIPFSSCLQSFPASGSFPVSLNS